MEPGAQEAKGAELISLMGCLILVIGGLAAIGGIVSLIVSGSMWLVIMGPILVWVGGVLFFVGRMKK